MINKYGDIATRAVHIILNKEETHPAVAWNNAASEMFGEGTWAQKKGCPKNAFLGLCEAGLVSGISSGIYVEKSGMKKNKDYAIKAIRVLKNKPEFLNSKIGLWIEVMNGRNMSHNSQMDVVLALWKNNLIHCEACDGGR